MEGMVPKSAAMALSLYGNQDDDTDVQCNPILHACAE